MTTLPYDSRGHAQWEKGQARMKLARGELVRATKVFAQEDTRRTWRELLLTLSAVASAMIATWLCPWTAPKFAGSVLIALLQIRLFIFMHDVAHGSIFRRSPLGRAISRAIGLYVFVTPRAWDTIHNEHHRTVARPLPDDIMTVSVAELATRTLTLDQWYALSPEQRARYRIGRHPFVVFGALLTSFLIGHGLQPFFADPRRAWSGALGFLLWSTLIIAGLVYGSTVDTLALLVLPHILACGVGGFIFHAQHNFPAARILPERAWHPIDAALVGASFFAMHPVMHWLTGNIGFHHVHHINPRIPFYRLPEVMAAIPELKNPRRTSWRPREMLGCLRAAIWDPGTERLVSFADADRLERAFALYWFGVNRTTWVEGYGEEAS